MARAGHGVSVVARGPHLQAIRAAGLRLRVRDQVLTASVRASDTPADLGAHDLVVVTTKATALASVADTIAPLLSPSTIVAFPQNGMPWWYPYGLATALPRPPDIPPFALGRKFLALIAQERIMGGVIYSANAIESPGVVSSRSPEFNRLIIGPIDGREREQHARVREIFDAAGISAPKPDDIRDAMWRKLIANISGSIIALVTGSTSGACKEDAGLSEVFHRAVAESRAVAAAHGFALSGMINSHQMLAKLLDHRPSILQDYEQGRPMEIGEILLAPVAFARAVGLATPTIDTLASIAAKLASNRGLFSADEWAAVPLWGATPAASSVAAQ